LQFFLKNKKEMDTHPPGVVMTTVAGGATGFFWTIFTAVGDCGFKRGLPLPLGAPVVFPFLSLFL
jgi:hypothetical protein